MILLKCCLYGLSLLVLSIRALPTSFYSRQQHQPQQQLINENYFVDVHRFSSLFSTHLIFDHLDNTLTSLSKRVSLHFQDLVQVTAQPFDLNDDFVVDIELLKGQLQGAIGSFIEDSLPNIWNTRASVIDKATLTNYIEKVTMLYCQTNRNSVLNTCIENNSQQIVSTIDNYIQDHLSNIIHAIVKEDLPLLFNTTQSHVNGILAHFSHYLKKSSTTSINTANTIVMYHSFENSNDLISYLESAVTLYHESLENSSLQKYTSLARVD